MEEVVATARPTVDELTVSRAWHAGWFRPEALRTINGRPITVVYRGRWTFGFGPDFRGALIAFGAELRRGDVEVHLRGAGWREHGHHLNPAYNDVILHVVLDDDPRDQPYRRQDGETVPALALRPALRGPARSAAHDPALPPIGAVADGECVATVTPTTGSAAIAAIERAGDARLTAKAAGFEALFTAEAPGQTLYAGLLDALGYARNRAGMAALAAALPLAAIESRLPARDPAAAFQIAAALTLGVGGFLPFDSAAAELSALSFAERDAIEGAWAECGAPWRGSAPPITPSADCSAARRCWRGAGGRACSPPAWSRAVPTTRPSGWRSCAPCSSARPGPPTRSDVISAPIASPSW
jgi:hypothetical protein